MRIIVDVLVGVGFPKKSELARVAKVFPLTQMSRTCAFVLKHIREINLVTMIIMDVPLVVRKLQSGGEGMRMRQQRPRATSLRIVI